MFYLVNGMLLRWTGAAAVLLVLPVFCILSCSDGENTPSGPAVLFDGQITVSNDANVAIRLVEFTQVRGDLEYNGGMNVKVYPTIRYNLKNELDGGESVIFPGGDQVWVRFVADVADPGDPEQPLFENTVDLTVNGNTVVVVKAGGEYSIGPE
jgi:PKD repeat protein